MALGLLGGFTRAIDEDVFARGLLASFPGDDFAYLAQDSVALARSPVGAPVEVVILGSSAAREALDTREALARATGGRTAVRLLVAGALLPIEMLALVDRLPRDRAFLVVLEVSERNLGLPPAAAQALLTEPRLPLRSALQEAAAARLGLRPRARWTSALFLDQAPFFLARPHALLNLVRPAPEARFHQVDGMPAPTPAEWGRVARRVRDWLRRYPGNAAWNEQVYGELVHAVRSRGGEVVFHEATRNPRTVAEAVTDAEAAAAHAAYRARVPAFAAELDVAWWSVGEEAALGAADFVDYAHLRPGDGRRRYTETLARRCADAVDALRQGRATAHVGTR